MVLSSSELLMKILGKKFPKAGVGKGSSEACLTSSELVKILTYLQSDFPKSGMWA